MRLKIPISSCLDLSISLSSIMSLQILLLIPCFLFVSSSYCREITNSNEDFKDFFNIDGYITKLRKSLENNGYNELSNDVLLHMVDASTKLPSGFLDGNYFDLGDFDECYNIHEGSVYGKYCLGKLSLPGSQNQTSLKLFKQNFTERRPTIQIHPEPRLAGLGVDYMGVHWAACVPNSINPKDIPIPYLNFTEDFCYSNDTEPELSGGAIAVIVVLAIILAIMVASTAFDIYLYYTNRDSPHELLIAFSVLTNGRKIFASTSNPEQLLCLNGIKAISMMWVVIGHEYMYTPTAAPVTNFNTVQDFITDPANMFIRGATVSVDTFFLVGGLVTVYTFLKSVDKGVNFNIILFYIHRYLRLTPALLIMVLIHLFLINYMGNGPLWKAVDLTLVDTCEVSWWSTLLYITNYVRKGNCLPQTWYLTIDMQLYVLSPLILLPLSKFPKIGLMSLGFLIVAGILIPFGVGYGLDLTNSMDQKYMMEYYSQTYTRFGPYVIGMLLGYIIYKMKKTGWKLNLDPLHKTLIICASWLICLIGLVACVYAGNDVTKISFTTMPEPDRWGNSLYFAFNRNAWAVAVGIAIFLCVAGYGGPINSFLSLPIFQFLTKLSYSMYLIHYTIITMRYSMMRNLFTFSHLAIMHGFWGDFIFTTFLSLILCLSFESPIIIIEKYLFGRGAPPKRTAVEKRAEP